MKRDLRRIEATLNQLSQKSSALATVSRMPPSSEPVSAPPVSFEVQAKASKPAVSVPSVDQPDAIPPRDRKVSPLETEAIVVPGQLASESKESLHLPKFKLPSFTSHRNSANPALASSLLKDLLTITEGWQTELAQVLRDMQDLYAEGPIVDGWLESHAPDPDANPAVLRHAEPDRLMNYVEEICATPDAKATPQVPKSGYFLCGLNADGQVWSTPCPSEQVPSVSLAIARHQKLRQLLARKQELENRLNQLSETLVGLHSQLREA
ncbi:hypothetical protein [Myxacorys almedinensis]|uniref:Uncharacterized protein n=1 Tax=Myxacorys almedinensis A TaxID=2690445 RepID=A0A8J8CNG4_9CYAN|nr:hypothetical protein [Myxacorys almedinensis]NDJ19550.1 hypothetical protein [Myxacorys almedinensis A]